MRLFNKIKKWAIENKLYAFVGGLVTILSLCFFVCWAFEQFQN